jgi:hypothetical protein
MSKNTNKTFNKKTSNERLQKAQEIASNPSAYKVCECCDSIVVSGSVTCSNCHGYRFDDSQTRVVDQAIYLGTRKKTSVTASDLV